MGVCLIDDKFEELRFDYYDIEKNKEDKADKAKQKFINNQQIITVNKFQIEKIKKIKLAKKKTHDINNLGIEKNEEILLLSSAKKERAKTITEDKGSKVAICPTLYKKYDIINYPKDVFELINKIRNNPQSFIKDIEIAITNIKKYKNKIFYNGNIKIYLNKGEQMYNEAIEYLYQTKSMTPLSFNKDIGI